MTPEKLAAAMAIPFERAELWAEPLTAAMDEFMITGAAREAAFLATINHESNGLVSLVENLNYSARGLSATWARFSETGKRSNSPNELAFKLARKPVEIANTVYALRMGNGSYESGDGWEFRGRGPIQLTGRDNYRRAGKRLGIEIEHDPDIVLTPSVGALVAALHWYDAGCNDAADMGDFDRVSDLINIGRPTERFGDAIGFPDRLAKLRVATEAYA